MVAADVAVEDAAAPGGSERQPPASDSSRVALAVFLAVVVGAFPMYLVLGRHQWFFLDEWDFLVTRRAGSLHDLLTPHNEHWSTLPILVYRGLWSIVGLHSYVPYQSIVIALHLTAGVLLWVVMRRAGVQPWIATAAGSLFVLFGSGRQDIVWAFQMGFVASLVLGLAHLLLADHDGPLDRRDWCGVALGAVGLLCSGVAVTMVIVVGIATALRRGLRACAFHVVPLAAIYATWFATYGHKGVKSQRSNAHDTVGFVWVAFRNAFARLGQVPGVGVVMGAVLVVGLVLAWRGTPWSELRTRAAAPIAMLVGALVFSTISGYGRAGVYGTNFATAGRYAHLVGALVLPALAVAANAIVQRWRAALPFALALFVIGIPGNIGAVELHGFDRAFQDTRVFLLYPRAPFARDVPPSTPVDRRIFDSAPVTIGWLLEAEAHGKLGGLPAGTDEAALASASLTVLIEPLPTAGPPARCAPLRTPRVVAFRKGDVFSFVGTSLVVQMVRPDGTVSRPPTVFGPGGVHRFRTLAGPVALRFTARPLGASALLCR